MNERKFKMGWLVYKNGSMVCEHCGEREKIEYPITITILNEKSLAFEKAHKYCVATGRGR